MNFTGSINLERLIDAKPVRMRMGGTEPQAGIFIPLKQNPTIFQNEKGTFLGIAAFESKGNEYGNSHFIVANVQNKEIRDKYSKEELRDVAPILGNLKEIGREQRAVADAEAEPVDTSEPNDLPFD